MISYRRTNYLLLKSKIIVPTLLIVGFSTACGERVVGSPNSQLQSLSVTVYVANSGSNTVTPIFAPDNETGKPIRVGAEPQQIIISPDGKTAYVAAHRDVANRTSPATLTTIRISTNKAGNTVEVCQTAGSDKIEMAITPDGRTGYYLCPSTNSVIPFRTERIALRKPINVGSYPDAIAITPDGKTAYVANGGSTTVTPISTGSDKPGKPIRVGLGPTAIAIAADGKTAYVITPYQVTPISTATNLPGKAIKILGGRAIAITPDGRTAYIVAIPNPDSHQGVVIPITIASNTPNRAIKVGLSPTQIAITPNGAIAYVTNLGSGTVTPISVPGDAVGRAIRVGKAPSYLAITPDSRTVYVLNSVLRQLGSVTPIRVATNTVGNPIQVGRFPLGIAVGP